jgi:hypothetical protein
VFDKQPLLLGAIGIAVGAEIAASLPERRMSFTKSAGAGRPKPVTLSASFFTSSTMAIAPAPQSWHLKNSSR